MNEGLFAAYENGQLTYLELVSALTMRVPEEDILSWLQALPKEIHDDIVKWALKLPDDPDRIVSLCVAGGKSTHRKIQAIARAQRIRKAVTGEIHA